MGKLENPFIIFVAGPNGSGKSTMINALFDCFKKKINYLCQDDVARIIEKVYPDPIKRAEVAREIIIEIKNKYVENKISFILESVASHPSHAKFLEFAKKKGYSILTIFITTENPDINVERVAHRVENGGHDVPTDKIYSRYEKSMENIINYIKVSNSILIFDNSKNFYELTFLKSDDLITILNEKKWVKEYIENKLNNLNLGYEIKSLDKFNQINTDKIELLNVFDQKYMKSK